MFAHRKKELRVIKLENVCSLLLILPIWKIDESKLFLVLQIYTTRKKLWTQKQKMDKLGNIGYDNIIWHQY